ncbi:MAG: heat-shock protein Hsp90 [Selenomonadaceae bacterium]|nr:heat-shock protein Hsp90 [Selenomonadaceae bacterium]
MTKEEIKTKVQDLVKAPSCYAGLKALAEEWLKAEGTAAEKALSVKLVAELEADVQPIDEVIAFFGSAEGKKIFGDEKAAGMLKHFEEVKAAGGRWCDCPACAAGRVILDNKDVIL